MPSGSKCHIRSRPSPGPDPEIPDSRSPDSRFGRETGREFPVPDSAGNGNREIPGPRFPIRPGNGNRGPDWPQLGKSGIPCGVSTFGTILGWMLPKNLPYVLQMQPEILASPHLPSSTAKDRPMEDGDSDTEMADYGTDFSDDVDPNFDASSLPGHSRIGNRIPPFSRFWGGFPDSRVAGNRESGNGPFPVRPGTG